MINPELFLLHPCAFLEHSISKRPKQSNEIVRTRVSQCSGVQDDVWAFVALCLVRWCCQCVVEKLWKIFGSSHLFLEMSICCYQTVQFMCKLGSRTDFWTVWLGIIRENQLINRTIVSGHFFIGDTKFWFLLYCGKIRNLPTTENNGKMKIFRISFKMKEIRIFLKIQMWTLTDVAWSSWIYFEIIQKNQKL